MLGKIDLVSRALPLSSRQLFLGLTFRQFLSKLESVTFKNDCPLTDLYNNEGFKAAICLKPRNSNGRSVSPLTMQLLQTTTSACTYCACVLTTINY